MKFALLAPALIVLVASAACSSPSPSPSPAADITPAIVKTPFVATASQAASTPADAYAQMLSACDSDPNGSTIDLFSTSRRFVNLPRAIYPEGGQFMQISGTASGNWISNGGPVGNSIESSADCWSTYYEFDGDGRIDYRATSAVPGAPAYNIHFVVRAH